MVSVIFESRSRSKRRWVALFDCGADNNRTILEVAWKHNARIVSLSKGQQS